MLKNRIILLRTAYALKQKEFAEKIGLTSSYVSAIEHGKRTVLSPASTKLIAQSFHCDPDWLINGFADKVICNAIRDLLTINDIRKMADDLGVPVAFLEAVRECQISPAQHLISRLDEKGYGITQQIYGTPAFAKKIDLTEEPKYEHEKDKKIAELEGELKAYRQMYSDLLRRLDKKGE